MFEENMCNYHSWVYENVFVWWFVDFNSCTSVYWLHVDGLFNVMRECLRVDLWYKVVPIRHLLFFFGYFHGSVINIGIWSDESAAMMCHELDVCGLLVRMT